VEYEFTGDVELDDAGDFTSTESKFVGKPSLMVDREWHTLLSGLFNNQLDFKSYY